MTISKSIPLYSVSKKWQNSILLLLTVCGIFFVSRFMVNDGTTSLITSHAPLELSFDKFSLFIGSVFCVSLFVGLYPVRKENDVNTSFVYYVLGGLGIILSNNILTFFVFWAFQRSLPCLRFIRGIRNENTSGGGTFLIQ